MGPGLCPQLPRSLLQFLKFFQVVTWYSGSPTDMNLDVTPEASGLGSLTNHLVAGGLWAQVAMLLWQVDGGVNHLNEGIVYFVIILIRSLSTLLWQIRSMLPQFIYFLIVMIKLSPTLVWHSSSPSTAEQPAPQSKRGNRSQVVS